MKPREDVKRGLVVDWLEKAGEDYGVAEYLLTEQSPYLGAIGFHAQQAAEKYLKAYLVHCQVEFPKTHDLVLLLELVEHSGTSLGVFPADVAALNPYGVDARYPGDFPDVAPSEAREAVRLAEHVRVAVTQKLQQYLRAPNTSSSRNSTPDALR